MTDDVKEAAQLGLNGLKGDQPFDKINCITAELPFDQAILDAAFDEITSILNERTARLRGALARFGGVA